MKLILTLDTIAHAELSHIGGKAAQLWKLHAAGFPVPPSFCLTTTAFHRALAPYRERISRLLSGHDLSDADTARAVSGEIMTILANWELPAIVIEALDAAWPALEQSFPLAVRSSATAEDREDYSVLRASMRPCWAFGIETPFRRRSSLAGAPFSLLMRSSPGPPLGPWEMTKASLFSFNRWWRRSVQGSPFPSIRSARTPDRWW